MICECADCRRRPEADREFSCTQFEAHCGAGAAKKWKASFKIEPGQLDEVPLGEQASSRAERGRLDHPLLGPFHGSETEAP